MFYGGGLWGYFNQSCLDNLFSKSDFTIEQLLDEDNIINDVKMNQNKFADQMIKNPQYIQEMIKYAISMPSEDDDEKKKHKYPFISSELLGIQIQKIQEYFFSQHEDEDEHQLSEVATNENKSLDKSIEEKKSELVSNDDEVKVETSVDSQQESTNESNDKKKEESESNETKSSEEVKSDDQVPKEDAKAKVSEETAEEGHNDKVKDEVEDNSDKNKEDSAAKDAAKEQQEDWDDDDDDISNKSHEEIKHGSAAVGKQQIVKGRDLLNSLFSFLDTEEDINSTSAGYFNKIVMQLVSSREGYLWKHLKNNTNIIDNMFKHFYLKSVSKIAYFLISQDGIDLDPDVFIEQRVDMVLRLHKKFRESDDHEVLLNIQEILVQVNSTSLRPQNFEVKRSLFSLDNINILLESIENHKESFSQASLILSSYLDHYRQTIYNDNSNEDTDNYCSDGLNFGRKNDEAISKEFPLEYLQSKTSCLIKALMEENFNIEVPTHETQYGSRVQPYGLNRVKLLHLILCLLKTENVHVNNAIVENGFFTYLLNLIIKHEWNNILHNQIEQIYNESFKIAMKNDKVRDAIIKDAKFLDFIVANGKELKTQPGSSKKLISKGYVCMIVSFANQIEDQKDKLEWLEEAVKNTEGWNDFVNGSLKVANDLHKRDLGNEDPRKRKESEDSIPNNDLSIKEIYMKFISMYQNKTDDEPKNQNDDDDESEIERSEDIHVQESPESKPEEQPSQLQDI